MRSSSASSGPGAASRRDGVDRRASRHSNDGLTATSGRRTGGSLMGGSSQYPRSGMDAAHGATMLGHVAIWCPRTGVRGFPVSIQSQDNVRVSGADPARLIDELKRIAVEQLAAVPGGLFRPIEEQLQDKLQLGSNTAQRKDLMTVLALRQRNATLVMRYRELIARSFDDFRGRAMLSRSDIPLGLVSEDELEFHLAGQRLAEGIGRRYQQPLELLGLRFEALSRALGAPATTNPVGAVRLAGAFLRTFHDAELSDTLQPIVFRQYEQELSKVLGDLYARLNSQLAAAGFHADLRRSDAAPAPRVAPKQSPAPQPIGETVEHVPYVPPQPAANAGIDLFRVSA